ncbi:MAG: hypothetical protein AAF447_07075 [Myxococcota bacterium]
MFEERRLAKRGEGRLYLGVKGQRALKAKAAARGLERLAKAPLDPRVRHALGAST